MRYRPEIWERVVEGLDAGIVLVDPELRVEYWNPWMARVTGVPAGEIEGRLLADRFPRLEQTGALERLEQVVAEGVPAVFSHVFHQALFPTVGQVADAAAPLYQEVKSLPLVSGGEVRGAALLVYDMTAVVLREFALTEAARQLRALREEMDGLRSEMSLRAPSLDKILELLEAGR